MRGSLMRRWTEREHKEILGTHPCDGDATAAYNESGRATVSRQLVRYWRTVFIENDGKLASADRFLKEQRVFIKPQPDDDFGDVSFIPETAESILVIPDMHAPYHHPDTIPFLVAVRDHFNPDLNVCLGDETDFHALSFHDSDPNLDSAGAELEKAKGFLAELHDEFPELLVCHSNHGSMVYRRAKAHGIPVQAIKRYRDVLFPESGCPGWSWAYGWRIGTPMGTVMFKHQASGVLSEAAHNSCNLIVGHQHGNFGVEYAASSAHLYYAGHAGCLIDKDALAFAYGKHSVKKPIIGCMVILNGKPVPIPMVLDEEGRWRGTL